MSTLTLSLDGETSRYRLVVNNADLAAKHAATGGRCEPHAAPELDQMGQRLRLEGRSCGDHDASHTAWSGTFAFDPRQELRVGLPLLKDLPRGHRCVARLIDSSGGTLATRVLRAGAGHLTLEAESANASAGPGPNFFLLGFEHILTGVDHLLLLFLVLMGLSSMRQAIVVVSYFTLGHSLTLAAATFGWVHLPSSVVEPLIAATVIYVALRNGLSNQLRTERAASVFGVGLLHGLGFAAALRTLGQGQLDTLQPLLMFNLGVEAGQLGLALLALPFLHWLNRARQQGHLQAQRVLSGAGAIMGLVWLLQRSILL